MLQITSPDNDHVFQRNLQNTAKVTFTGKADAVLSIIATPITKGVQVIEHNIKPDSFNNFSKTLTLTAGDYEVSISSTTEIQKINVHVGVVFVVMGHSFSEGNGSSFVTSDRVICPDSFLSPMTDTSLYQSTGFMKMKNVSLDTIKNYENVEQVNYSKSRGIWGRMADKLVELYDVPVCIVNCGFGGTTIEQWALSAQNQYFEHGFADYSKRMPIIKFLNALKYLIPRTGCQGVLCIHGDNDIAQKPTAQQIADWYKIIIDTSRNESGFKNLNFVLATSAYESPYSEPIIEGTRLAIQQNTNVLPGPAIYQYSTEFRLSANDFHLNTAGEAKAAQDFAKILGTGDYLLNAIPVTIEPKEDKTEVINITSNATPTVQNTIKDNSKYFLYGGLALLSVLLIWLVSLIPSRK